MIVLIVEAVLLAAGVTAVGLAVIPDEIEPVITESHWSGW